MHIFIVDTTEEEASIRAGKALGSECWNRQRSQKPPAMQSVDKFTTWPTAASLHLTHKKKKINKKHLSWKIMNVA